MNKLSKKLFEEIKSNKIKIKALGKTCGRIFRLEADDNTYLNITLGSLILSAFTAVGLLIFKSVAASQDMVVDGLEVSGNELFLHGRCLNIHKDPPKINEEYTLLENHDYNIDFYNRLNENYSVYLESALNKINVDQNFKGLETNETVLKQLITWIHNDKPSPYTLFQKIGSQNNQLSFRSIYNVILADNILIDLTKNKEFHSDLDEYIMNNINYNDFTINELILLKKVDYLNRLNISTI
jgi:hypothetical protein